MASEDELSGEEILASSKVFRAAAALAANDHERASFASSVALRPYYQTSAARETALEVWYRFRDRRLGTRKVSACRA